MSNRLRETPPRRSDNSFFDASDSSDDAPTLESGRSSPSDWEIFNQLGDPEICPEYLDAFKEINEDDDNSYWVESSSNVERNDSEFEEADSHDVAESVLSGPLATLGSHYVDKYIQVITPSAGVQVADICWYCGQRLVVEETVMGLESCGEFTDSVPVEQKQKRSADVLELPAVANQIRPTKKPRNH